MGNYAMLHSAKWIARAGGTFLAAAALAAAMSAPALAASPAHVAVRAAAGHRPVAAADPLLSGRWVSESTLILGVALVAAALIALALWPRRRPVRKPKPDAPWLTRRVPAAAGTASPAGTAATSPDSGLALAAPTAGPSRGSLLTSATTQ